MPGDGKEMPFDITVGLFVSDQAQYAQYRAEMTPLLEAAGGRFRYDFEVARMLKTEAGHEINRVFVIRFPDRGTRERFFADPVYRGIRTRLFEPSVTATTLIAESES